MRGLWECHNFSLKEYKDIFVSHKFWRKIQEMDTKMKYTLSLTMLLGNLFLEWFCEQSIQFIKPFIQQTYIVFVFWTHSSQFWTHSSPGNNGLMKLQRSVERVRIVHSHIHSNPTNPQQGFDRKLGANVPTRSTFHSPSDVSTALPRISISPVTCTNTHTQIPSLYCTCVLYEHLSHTLLSVFLLPIMRSY